MKVIVQLLRQTLTGAISWQTRNEKSIRQALTSPPVAPQWVAALLALRATVTTERVWRALCAAGGC
jgi:hypothetical protein